MAPAPDVVVVGGGAAGCVVAARLSEDPDRRVLLLEAGPDLRAAPPEDIRSGWGPTRSFDWGYVSEPGERGTTRALPRGRLLGGCSSTNATFALRGSPADYDAWAAAGNPGWSFEEVLPFFARLERDLDFGDRPWHGDAGPLPIRRYQPGELTDVAAAGLAALEAAGLPLVEDHNAPGAVGAGHTPVNCLDGVRMSTALTYLPAPGERPNLEVRCESEAHELVLDGARAIGVRLAGAEVLGAGRVVLSAGAYGSPALLLRSGIGPPDRLAALGIPVRAALPGVGANLADHAGLAIMLPYRGDPAPAPRFQVVGTHRSAGAGSGDPPDIQIFAFGPFPATASEPAHLMIAAALLKPRSRGRLTLATPAPDAPPLIDLGHLRDPDDLARIAEGLDLAAEVAAHPDVRALCAPGGPVAGPPAGLKEREEWMRRTCWTYHHPVGTCAMGPAADPLAVVDARGAVHGIEGLHVADASVMPDIPSANTQVPTLMVAERITSLLAAAS
jgi:choline dehydrogenase